MELMVGLGNFLLHPLLILTVDELFVGELLLESVDDLLQGGAL